MAAWGRAQWGYRQETGMRGSFTNPPISKHLLVQSPRQCDLILRSPAIAQQGHFRGKMIWSLIKGWLYNRDIPLRIVLMRSYTQKYANPSIKGLRVLWLWRALTFSPNHLKFQPRLSTFSMGIFSALVWSGFKQMIGGSVAFFPQRFLMQLPCLRQVISAHYIELETSSS